MNKVAIAILVNDHKYVVGLTWPKLETLKHQAKRRLSRLGYRLAMALIPMPQVAAA